MAPSFRVKLPDSILDILYKCTIGTNSLPADSSKHCKKKRPVSVEVSLHGGLSLSCNTFSRDVTIFAKRHVDL